MDIGITKKLLEGERGKIIREKDIVVSGFSNCSFTVDQKKYIIIVIVMPPAADDCTCSVFSRLSGNLVCLLPVILPLYKKLVSKL